MLVLCALYVLIYLPAKIYFVLLELHDKKIGISLVTLQDVWPIAFRQGCLMKQYGSQNVRNLHGLCSMFCGYYTEGYVCKTLVIAQ